MKTTFRQRTANTMIIKDKAWLAGFVDGEGYIGINRQRKKTTRENYASFLYHPYLIISSTDKKIISNIKNITGCGWAITNKRSEPGYKDSYQYKLTKFNDLLHILEQLHPLLKIKFKQCDLLIKYINIRIEKCETKISGRGSRGMTNFSEIEEKIYTKLRILNKRGKNYGTPLS